MKRICIPINDEKFFQNYLNALNHLGVEPVFVYEPCEAAGFDGLLLPGGEDINPARYGQENRGSEEINDDLDNLQFAVLDNFLKTNKPIMGICRGHQLLNVYFGGTLIQDIEEKAYHKWLEPKGDNINTVIADDGSILERLYGKRFKTNSSHHQAVDKPGKGLKIVAKADDGIVESLEHESLPIFSVQFHPERMCFEKANPEMVDGSEVLKYFLDRC